jgi:hypothetical protein
MKGSPGAGVKQLELDEKKIPVSRDGDRGNRGGIRKSEFAKLEKFIASKISS